MHGYSFFFLLYHSIARSLSSLPPIVYIIRASIGYLDYHHPIPSLPVELPFISSTTRWMKILSFSLMKRSFFNRFIKEKDEIIIQSVIEDRKSSSTGKLGIGIWESISKKIPNRSPDYIYDHFQFTLGPGLPMGTE